YGGAEPLRVEPKRRRAPRGGHTCLCQSDCSGSIGEDGERRRRTTGGARRNPDRPALRTAHPRGTKPRYGPRRNGIEELTAASSVDCQRSRASRLRREIGGAASDVVRQVDQNYLSAPSVIAVGEMGQGDGLRKASPRVGDR